MKSNAVKFHIDFAIRPKHTVQLVIHENDNVENLKQIMGQKLDFIEGQWPETNLSGEEKRRIYDIIDYHCQ